MQGRKEANIVYFTIHEIEQLKAGKAGEELKEKIKKAGFDLQDVLEGAAKIDLSSWKKEIIEELKKSKLKDLWI